jgi:hypothetical protein
MLRTIHAIVILFLILTATALGETLWWTGAANSKWDNPNNWDPPQVPTKDDNVQILDNTRPCQISGQVTVHHLENNGTIESYQGDAVFIETQGGFENNGKVSTGDSWLQIKSNVNVENSGTITGGKVDIVAKGTFGITNGSTGEIKSYGYPAKGNISLTAERPDAAVTNNGKINAGDGKGSMDGGNVTIIGATLNNTGQIVAGNGGVLGNDGKVNIYANKVVDKGSIVSGQSSPGAPTKVQKVAEEGTLGDLAIVADTIDVSLVDAWIEAGVWKIIGKIIRFSDINNFAGAQIFESADFYTTSDGQIDFSGTHTQNAIFGGTKRIYSDRIIAPTEGLDYIMVPAPEIFPADTSMASGMINTALSARSTGESGTLLITMQNHSTVGRVLNYSVSSMRGWVTPLTNSTVSLAPFDFASDSTVYVIPEGTLIGIEDTVVAIVSIGASFADTAYSTIFCLGTSGSVPVKDVRSPAVPDMFALFQNHPNPFNPETTISYEVKESCRVVLKVFDMRGREVATLVDGVYPSGFHSVRFDASRLPTGLYFYKIKMKDFSSTRKMAVIK